MDSKYSLVGHPFDKGTDLLLHIFTHEVAAAYMDCRIASILFQFD